MYAQETKTKVINCAKCGRTLGIRYYWKCRKCGATYCYVHIPSNPTCPHESHMAQIYNASTRSSRVE